VDVSDDLKTLRPALEEARRERRTLVLATMVATEGSSYRKAGAKMLMSPDGRWWGLLGGGCFEGDLVDRALEALAGPAQIVEYDLRGESDILWGLGAGCEGTIRILLQRLTPDKGYQPLAGAVELAADRGSGVIATVVEPGETALVAGDAVVASSGRVISCTGERAEHALGEIARSSLGPGAARGLRPISLPSGRAQIFIDPLEPPPSLFIAGAGPDAVPMARAACELGWDVTIADHRAGWARPGRFPAACRVICLEPRDLENTLAGEMPDAALVMTHHLAVDTRWLEALARRLPAWIGVLGPARRKARLLGDVSDAARKVLEPRLQGPVGLDIGGEGPGPIALSTIAGIQAALAGRDGGPIRKTR
jgi:xanthine/CO dehydrogenase XdhC/CoxF family maturation factor